MGILYVVATPIGNLGDISPRALEVLRTSSLIAAEDTRHTIKLLNHFQIRTKMISYHKFNEKERSEQIIRRVLDEDIAVALVSDAGTPCISDPGYELVRQAREAGIEVVGISGPSAVITAISISGFKAESFAFYGFPPRQNAAFKRLLEQIQANDTSLFVLYESPKRIAATMQSLAGLWPDCRTCVCCDLSKFHEKSSYGTVAEVASELAAGENTGLGEYTIVVEKQNIPEQETEQQETSLEALLLERMLDLDCTLKDAIGQLQQERPELGRKMIYQASLRLKNFCRERFSDK